MEEDVQQRTLRYAQLKIMKWRCVSLDGMGLFYMFASMIFIVSGIALFLATFFAVKLQDKLYRSTVGLSILVVGVLYPYHETIKSLGPAIVLSIIAIFAIGLHKQESTKEINTYQVDEGSSGSQD